MGEAKSATDDALGMNDYPPDKLDIETSVGMLNADQSQNFDRVKEHHFLGEETRGWNLRVCPTWVSDRWDTYHP